MIIGSVRALMVPVPAIHGLLPVEPDEISGERTENEIEPERIVEAEGCELGADVRVGLEHQARRRKADIHDEPRQHLVT